MGLTGGIASGKSTVSAMLAERGALIIDADEIVHQLLGRGGGAYGQVLDTFGKEILGERRSIDRRTLGTIVFNDPDKRRDLELILHPLVYAEIIRRTEDASGHSLVVVDAALLVETLPDRGRSMGMKALVTVSSSPDHQVDRLVGGRGMTEADARARMDAQAPESLRMAKADYVLVNRGTIDELKASVDALWNDLVSRFGSPTGAAPRP